MKQILCPDRQWMQGEVPRDLDKTMTRIMNVLRSNTGVSILGILGEEMNVIYATWISEGMKQADITRKRKTIAHNMRQLGLSVRE